MLVKMVNSGEVERIIPQAVSVSNGKSRKEKRSGKEGKNRSKK
jgi:hypothetical protein